MKIKKYSLNFICYIYIFSKFKELRCICCSANSRSLNSTTEGTVFFRNSQLLSPYSEFPTTLQGVKDFKRDNPSTITITLC